MAFERLPEAGFVRGRVVDPSGATTEFRFTDRDLVRRRLPSLARLLDDAQHGGQLNSGRPGFYVRAGQHWVEAVSGVPGYRASPIRPSEPSFRTHADAVLAACWADRELPGELAEIEPDETVRSRRPSVVD